MQIQVKGKSDQTHEYVARAIGRPLCIVGLQ